jgi:hypothetical protein
MIFQKCTVSTVYTLKFNHLPPTIDNDGKPQINGKDLWQSADYRTVKGARGKVSFDSQNDKYASQLFSDASPEAYLLLRKLKSVFVILEIRCDKYAAGKA